MLANDTIQRFIHSPPPVAYIVYTRAMVGHALNQIDPRLVSDQLKKVWSIEETISKVWVKSQRKR